MIGTTNDVYYAHFVFAVPTTQQQGGLGLDYVQFGCVVQLGELTLSMTRQQGGLNLDYLLDQIQA